jgi:hypothetical protein
MYWIWGKRRAVNYEFIDCHRIMMDEFKILVCDDGGKDEKE